MPVMQALPDNHPLMMAWNEYRATEEAISSEKWARTSHVTQAGQSVQRTEASPYLEGALWAAFMAGFKASNEHCARLHENVNPASDDERHNKAPGAGAMGAVIEYRDLIRATQ